MTRFLFAVCCCLCGTNANAIQRIDTPRPLLSVPLIVEEDIPLVQVRINGSQPLWFILDTGASACVVDQGLAKQLNLRMEGQGKVAGVGAGTQNITFAKNVVYGVDNIRLQVPDSYVIDLSGVVLPGGRKLDGLLGYDFIQQYVVVLDYEQGRMHLYEQKTFAYSGQGQKLLLELRNRVPYVKAKLHVAGQPSVERSWLVDTGAADTFDDELLAQTTSPKREALGGIGLGEPKKIILARAERIELGRFTLRDVPGVTGGMKIGSGLLRRFTVIIDYHRLSMILEPNRSLNDAFLVDASGLELRSEEKGQRMIALLANSPATEVGLRQNDLLLSVDGRDTSAFKTGELRQLFSRSGNEHTLRVQRGTNVFQVRIRLRRLY
jgi:hypothetical protein